jgi:hypothetical protein
MKKRSTLAIIVCLALFSCASMGINLDTTEKKYLAARENLNLLIEQAMPLRKEMDRITRANLGIAFKNADKVLDAWGRTINIPDYDYRSDLKLWLEAKGIILGILAEVQ